MALPGGLGLLSPVGLLALVPVVVLYLVQPDPRQARLVDVPQHDEVKIGTLHSIADQCGAEDFRAWCRWIDEHC